jgi:hypothetical protein
VKNIKQITLNNDSLRWLYTMAFMPFEMLSFLVGTVCKDTFITLETIPLTLNPQFAENRISRILSDEKSIYEILNNRMTGFNNHLLGIFERMTIVFEEFSRVMEKINEMIISLPISTVLVHNHPIVLPKNLTSDERKEFQVAYDLTDKKLSFSQWLMNFQARDFSEEDIDVIRHLSPDGLGILVYGKKVEEASRKGWEWFDEFATACQAKDKVIEKIEIGIVPWNKFEHFDAYCQMRQYANAFCDVIISSVLSK